MNASRAAAAIAFFVTLAGVVFGDEDYWPDAAIEIRKTQPIRPAIEIVTYYIHGPIIFSSLTKRIEGYLNIKGASMTLWFEEAAVTVDEVPVWVSNFPTVEFIRSTVEFRNAVFGDVRSLEYNVKNYDPYFYKCFPNLNSLSVCATDLSDLAFLWQLPALKSVRLQTGVSDKRVLSKMFRQFHRYITTTQNGMEGFIDFKTPLAYPYAYANADVFMYYADPPSWYDGPDISGVPAWVNDDKVMLRKVPSFDSPVLGLMNTGDYVLIKGKTGEGPNAAPWNSEKSFREEDRTWIKVRLPNRTDGYVYSPFLTLKNPNYYPVVRETESEK